MKNDLLMLTQNTATKDNVQNALGKFWKNRDMSDVTLATDDGTQQKAHRVILASSSPFFERLFQRNPDPKLLIYLKGVSKSTLEMVLKFVYLSQVELLQEDLNGFLDLGKELQISGLVEDVKLSQRKKQGSFSPTSVTLKSPEQPSTSPSVPGDDQTQGGYFQPCFKKVPILSQAKVGPIQKSSANTNISGELLKDPQSKTERVENLDESFSLLLEPETPVGEKAEERKGNQTKNRKFPCDQCEGMYASKASLYGHKRYVHERAYLLENNDQKEGQKLKSQPKQLEKDEKKCNEGHGSQNLYKCDKCGKTFEKMPNLFTHKKAEHGGSLHACESCEYEASQAVNLERHRRTEHGELKEDQKKNVDDIASKNLYRCDQCDLAFPRLPILFNHKKSEHLGALHSCNFCDYQSTQLANLKRHKDVQHNVTV